MARFDSTYHRLVRHSDEAIAKIELSMTAQYNNLARKRGHEAPVPRDDPFLSSQEAELIRLWHARDLIFRCYKLP